MTNANDLLLRTDPQSFMAIVQEHDPKKRINSLYTLDDMMSCEALRHGIFDDQKRLR